MRFDVWLVSFAAGKAPAKALVQAYGIDMQEALTLELTLPTIVARDLSEGAAARAVLELRSIGGRAEARPADKNAPLGFDLPFTESGWDEPDPSAPTATPPPEEDAAPAIPSLPAPRRKKAPAAEPGSGKAAAKAGASGDSASGGGASGDGASADGASGEGKQRRDPTGSVRTGEPENPRRKRKTGSTGKAKRPRPAPLQVVDVQQPRRQRAAMNERPPQQDSGSGLNLSAFVPMLGAAAVTVGALYAALWRGQTALLGTADILGLAIDSVVFAGLLTTVVLLVIAFRSDRNSLDAGPLLALVVLGGGAAYGLNMANQPTVNAQSETGDEAEGLLTQNDVHFVGLDQQRAGELVASLRAAGAISVRAAAPTSFMGTTAYHGLAVGLPAGPTSRARIAEALRTRMSQDGTPMGPMEPPAEDEVWVVPLGRP